MVLAETLTRIQVRQHPGERDRIQFLDLDGVRLGLRLRYAASTDRWHLWVLDLAGSVIAGPRRVVPGIDLLVGAKHDPRVPPGQLFCYSATREPPTAATIDASCVLYYRKAR